MGPVGGNERTLVDAVCTEIGGIRDWRNSSVDGGQAAGTIRSSRDVGAKAVFVLRRRTIARKSPGPHDRASVRPLVVHPFSNAG